MASTKRVLESSKSAPASDSESNEEYEVERILAQVQVDEDSEMLYLVKWKGYEDRECTWEPVESFQDPSTLIEWQEKLAKDDFLPESKVQRVQQLMDEFKTQQARLKEEARQARQAKRRKLLQRKDSPAKSESPVRKSEPPIRKDSAVIRQHQPVVRDKVPVLQPSFTPHYNLAKSTASSTTHKATHIPATAGTTHTAKRRRSTAGEGAKFRNLSHMNNLQKKAARADVAPSTTNLIAPSGIARREPAHILPPTKATSSAPDSPLFFAEGGSPVIDPVPQFPNLASAPVAEKSGNEDFKLARAEPKAASKVADDHANWASIEHSKLTSRSSRAWTIEEVLVQLSLGDHQVGDVKLAGLQPWLRKILINLKVGDQLSFHFEQNLVFNRQEFSDVSADWPPAMQGSCEVHPFDDTQSACDSLATYFEQFNSAAIWTYPDRSISSIALILHSSSQPRWRQANYVPLTGKMPRLLIGVRNRAGKGQLPPPLIPPQILESYATSPSIGGSGFGTISLRQQLTGHIPSSAPHFPPQTVMTSAVQPRSSTTAPGLSATSELNPEDTAPLFPTPAPQDVQASNTTKTTLERPPVNQNAKRPVLPEMTLERPPVNQNAKRPVLSEMTLERSPVNQDAKRPVLSEIENIEVPERATAQDQHVAQQETDWKCDLVYHAMLKDGSNQKRSIPLVYIAFGNDSPLQASALKTWATTNFTLDRWIFVESASHKVWTEFYRAYNASGSPAIVLFGEDPAFCRLSGLGGLLGKSDTLSLFSLSWSRDTNPGRTPHYTQTRIFPRGTVILLSEATLRQPAATLDILTWFEKHSKSKSKSWRVMVRPNVRAWLQHIALNAEDNEVGRRYLDVLVQIHKLSSVVDVTAVGHSLSKLQLLEAVPSRTEKAEEFVIPMPWLDSYDASSNADTSPAAIAQRDEALLRHFVGWSALNVSEHRRFMAIDEDRAKEGRDKTIYDNAHHIVFRSAEQFRREISEKKNGALKKQS